MTTLVNAYHGGAPGHRQRVRQALNRLLNENLAAPVFLRCVTRSLDYYGVLTQIHREIGAALDFADESHRVRIGLGLIQRIRTIAPSLG